MTLLEEESLKLTEVQRLEGYTDRVWGLAWNPATGANGVRAILASCSGNKTVRIWQQRSPSSTSFDCNAVLEDRHTRTIRSCSWSPSGKQLATASFDATTTIWEQNGTDFECVSTLEGHENEVKSCFMECIWEVLPGNEFYTLFLNEKTDLPSCLGHVRELTDRM
ncbi:hypothetical protein LXL04_006697 [Taraxacum kok-saghyz]